MIHIIKDKSFLAIVAIFIVTITFFYSCSAELPEVHESSNSSSQYSGSDLCTSLLPTATKSPMPIPTIPMPTAAYSDLFAIKQNPGHRIGNFVTEYKDVVYYQKDNSIYRIKDGQEKRIVKTNLFIQSIFTDQYGTLYYHGWKGEYNTDGPLYKYVNGKSILLDDSVYQVIRVDDEYIFYDGGLFRYNIREGKKEKKSYNDSYYSKEIISSKPLIVNMINDENIFLFDLLTFKQYHIELAREFYYTVSRDGSCFLYQNVLESTDTVHIIDLKDDHEYIINSPYYGAFFVCGDQVVIVDRSLNRLYSRNKKTNVVMFDQPIVIDKDYYENEYYDYSFVEDGKVYICEAKITQYDDQGYPMIASPVVYSYNPITGVYKKECETKPINIRDAGLYVEIEGGYCWFYTCGIVSSAKYKFVTRVPVSK